jgi:ABC-2 type transport system permease protein
MVTELKNGVIPENADLLVLASPYQLDEKQVFAIDQFLMQGGTVIIATSPYNIDMVENITAKEQNTGLHDWLVHHGIDVEKKFVMDTQSSAFPIPVQRDLGGIFVQETRMIDYPYFVDIRESGMEENSGINAGLNQLTVNWASPLIIDEERNQSRKVIPLLHSSERSWVSTSLDIQPNIDGGRAVPDGEQGRQLLAAAVEGQFESFFKGKESPLLSRSDENEDDTTSLGIGRMIEKSPESSRIIVFTSETFLSDSLLTIASRAMGTQYVNPVQLVANAVDWSLEEQALLSIRGRTHFSRTLKPLDKNDHMFWEYLNYGLALIGLLLVWIIRRQVYKRKQQRYLAVLASN